MKHDEEQLARLLRDLGDELPYAPPRADRMNDVRNTLSLLPPPARAPASRRLAVGLAAAAAAAVVVTALAIGLSGKTEQTSVRASSGAKFVHTPATRGTPEIVHLSKGTVELRVPPLARGERMLLKTEDAEVEVHGTVFEVTATAGRLASVEVLEGVVEVRKRGEGSVVLRAGDRWPLPEPKPDS